MARARKEGRYLNVRIASSIYEKLEDVCEESGLLKTTLVERALTSYFEDYDRKQEILRAAFEKEGIRHD